MMKAILVLFSIYLFSIHTKIYIIHFERIYPSIFHLFSTIVT